MSVAAILVLVAISLLGPGPFSLVAAVVLTIVVWLASAGRT
jgi:hypothetical protein